MLLPIHPPDPSSSLLDAVVAAGFQPVPVTDIDDVIERAPKDGWAPAVICGGPKPASSGGPKPSMFTIWRTESENIVAASVVWPPPLLCPIRWAGRPRSRST